MAFSFQIVEDQSLTVIKLIGKLINEEDAKTMNDKIDLEITSGQNKWIFDLSELLHCNSSGLNVMIRSLTKTRVAGGDTVLCHLNDGLKQIFSISKTDEIFSIFADVNMAKQHFN
ncbi:MAG: anti-anti-sigma factor [Lentimonas sp.]|jgi:anti-anti-sigma factor